MIRNWLTFFGLLSCFVGLEWHPSAQGWHPMGKHWCHDPLGWIEPKAPVMVLDETERELNDIIHMCGADMECQVNYPVSESTWNDLQIELMKQNIPIKRWEATGRCALSPADVSRHRVALGL